MRASGQRDQDRRQSRDQGRGPPAGRQEHATGHISQYPDAPDASGVVTRPQPVISSVDEAGPATTSERWDQDGPADDGITLRTTQNITDAKVPALANPTRW
jgi:hypothetical protein